MHLKLLIFPPFLIIFTNIILLLDLLLNLQFFFFFVNVPDHRGVQK